MFKISSVTMVILAAALVAATGANAREASEGPRGGDNAADVAERAAGTHHQGRGADDLPGHIRHGRGADDLPGHIRHGRGADDLPGVGGGTAGGINDDGTPDQGLGDN